MPNVYGEGGGQGGYDPPRPPRPDDVNIPGAIPDYLTLAKAGSRYQRWLADANRRRGIAASKRRESVRSLLMNYGGRLPDGFADAFGDTDPDLIAAAANNPNSQTNLMARAFQQRGAAEEDMRTSRGIMGDNMGQELFEQRQAATDRSQSESDMLQQLLAALRGSIGAYTDEDSDITGEEDDVLGLAMDDVRTENPVGESMTAVFEAGSQAKYGRPVYRTPNGQRFIIGDDGNPVRVDNTLVPKDQYGGGVGAARRAIRGRARGWRR